LGERKSFLLLSVHIDLTVSLEEHGMSYLPQLLALACVWGLVVISPGPNFIATVHHTVSRSRRDGLLVACGISVGTAVWGTVSLIGIGVLFARFSWIMEIIRTVGAVYLTYLGIKMIWKAHRHKQAPEQEVVAPRRGTAWQVGLLTDISNPKAAAFFGSLFALFLPAHAPLWLQGASVIVVVMIAAVWYSTVACVFSFGPVARWYRRARKWIDTVTGGVLVALGVRLAVSK
jgi:threonine efflux protein